MKVLVLNESIRPKGGAEIYVRTHVQSLARRGHELVLVSGDRDPPDAELAGVRWYSMPDVFVSSLRPRSLLVSYAAVEALRRVLREETPDVALVHLFDSVPALSAVLGAVPTIRFVHTAWPYCPAGTRWLPRSNIECHVEAGIGCLSTNAREGCLTTSEGKPYSLKDSLRRIIDLHLQSAFFERAALVAANSNYTARQVERLIGRSNKMVILCPPVAPSEAPDRAPVPGRLLVAGRLVRGKGVADAIRAAAKLPGAHLAIVGDGPQRRELEILCETLGVADRVEFLGWLSRAAVDAEMKMAAIVLFPSRWPETFGQVGPQAAMNGRPVVAYDSGGVSTWLDEDTGVLVPAGDEDAFARGIERLLVDPALASEMGRTASARSAQFSVETFVVKLENAMIRAVEAGVPRA